MQVVVRNNEPSDSIAAHTECMREAYAVHAKSGLRYWARHQTIKDTADPAFELIAMCRRWGCCIVGTCDWRPDTNFTSVIMQLDLEGETLASVSNPSP